MKFGEEVLLLHTGRAGRWGKARVKSSAIGQEGAVAAKLGRVVGIRNEATRASPQSRGRNLWVKRWDEILGGW